MIPRVRNPSTRSRKPVSLLHELTGGLVAGNRDSLATAFAKTAVDVISGCAARVSNAQLGIREAAVGTAISQTNIVLCCLAPAYRPERLARVGRSGGGLPPILDQLFDAGAAAWNWAGRFAQAAEWRRTEGGRDTRPNSYESPPNGGGSQQILRAEEFCARSRRYRMRRWESSTPPLYGRQSMYNQDWY
jgi:hypothetical protein